jgi:DNA-directed RNA polymerase specialized sigma24 family protein
MADEEDVVLSAFDSFCRNATAGRFPLLNDRDGLWKLLFAITERKVLDQVKFDKRQKRGGGKVRGESVFMRANDSTALHFGDDVEGREPTPEFAAQVAEQVQLLLDDLNEEPLRDVALMKMEGFNNEEIAVKLDCSPRSVTRRLKVIRTIWSERLP